MRSTFKLLFYINRQKVKRNGKCPVMGRITVDGKMAQYATGLEIAPDLWNPATGRVHGPGKRLENLSAGERNSIRILNLSLDMLEEKATKAYHEMAGTTGYVSAELVKNVLTDKAQAKRTLLALFDEHNEEYAKRVGIDRTRHSYMRYLTGRKHLSRFLRYRFDAEDIPLRQLDMKFIEDYEFYLSTVLRLKTVTLNDYLISLHKIARRSVKQRTVPRDPFAGHKLQSVPVNHRYLIGEQLAKLMSADLPTYRLCHARDLFVFSTFTGLGRADLAKLAGKHIVTEADGSRWIRIDRQKTKTQCHIKLLDIPARIIDKYRGEGDGDRLFYVPGTGSLCRSLKMIAERCNLGCHLTFYQARHTFATLICLDHGVPIETISRMMGHSSIRTTQIYAEIMSQKVGRDLTLLADTIKNRYSLPDDAMPLRVYRPGRYNGWKEESVEQVLQPSDEVE